MLLLTPRSLTPDLIDEVYNATYSPTLQAQVGQSGVQAPPIEEFYRAFSARYNNGLMKYWGWVKDGEYKGHVILDKTVYGEWELGVMLSDPMLWKSGAGVRMAIFAMYQAFEVLDSKWLVAVPQSIDPTVVKMLERGGFVPFSKVLLMNTDGWIEHWASKAPRIISGIEVK
jgi:hypothetical protein